MVFKKMILMFFIVFFLCSCGTVESFGSIKPREDISLQEESYLILDTAQIGGSLFILGEGKVTCIDLLTNKRSHFIETDCRYIEAYDNILHLFNPESLTFYAYQTDGTLISERTMTELFEYTPHAFKSFGVCDDYYVIKNQEDGKSEILTINRQSGEINRFASNSDIRRFCSYEDNELLVLHSDFTGTKCSLSKLDLKRGKIKKLCDLNNIYLFYDFEFSANYKKLYLASRTVDGVAYLYEINLDSGLIETVKTIGIDVPTDENYHLSVGENIVSLVSSSSFEYDYYDIENPPEYITLSYLGVTGIKGVDMPKAIFEFEEEKNIIVRTVCYDDEQVVAFNTKILAGDNDFDCFYTYSLPIYVFPKTDNFVDLYEFEELKDRIKSNSLASYVSECGGKCFGLPVGLDYQSEARGNATTLSESEIEALKKLYEEIGMKYNESSAETYTTYLYKNIDVIDSRFFDIDGEELYKVLCHLYDNPDDPIDKAIYQKEDIGISSPEFIVVNPASEKKQLVAEFLTFVFDEINSNDKTRYPEVSDDELENIAIDWRYNEYEIVEPLLKAKQAVTRDDMGRRDIANSPDPYVEIRKIAQKAAREVCRRLEG